jgi:hypothetical protein
MAEIDRWNNFDELEASRLMYPMVSIDPGDIHVGVAVWDEGTVAHDEEDHDVDAWICQDAFETRPVPFLRALQVAVGSGAVQTVVFERFVLEPERVQASVGSDMLTSQMIGAIKFAVNGRCEVIGQTNQIKNPTRSVLRRRGVKSVAKRNKAGGHAFDAELHGAHYIIRTLGQEIANDD